MLLPNNAWSAGEDAKCDFALAGVRILAELEEALQKVWPGVVILGILPSNLSHSVADLVADRSFGFSN